MEQKNAAVKVKNWPLSEKFEQMLCDCDEIEAKGIFPTGERYKHEKRGTIYDIYGVGHANSAEGVYIEWPSGPKAGEQKVLFDRDEVVIYRDVQSGALSIRGKTEFLDGRFTLLPRAPGERLPDPARALIERVEDGSVSPITNGQPPRSTTAPEGSQRVEYFGPDMRKKRQRGTVLHWDLGTVTVRWDNPDLMGVTTKENALSIKEYGLDKDVE